VSRRSSVTAQQVDSFVAHGSHMTIQECLKSSRDRLTTSHVWLEVDNPYNTLNEALRKKTAPIDPQSLAEYVACSAPLHVVDGWNYLAQAFAAVIRGDRFVAYHLAYYAELRAAMSLLASEGVGIFNDRHFAIGPNLSCRELNGNTHRMSWKCLKAWASEPSQSDRVLASVVVESKSISEWLSLLGVTVPSQQWLVRNWLRAWSVDLEHAATDRFRRNEMSYRPTRIRNPKPADFDATTEMLEPLLSSWAALEPLSHTAVAALDVILLRRSIELAIDQGWSNHESIETALQEAQSLMSDDLSELLELDGPEFQSLLADAASAGDPFVNSRSVLARALLMLRLASAKSAVLLRSAGIDGKDLRFWWSRLGVDHGWWSEDPDVEVLVDLWTEVDDNVSFTQDAMNGHLRGCSVRHASGEVAGRVSLTQFSRAAMWLLGFGEHEIGEDA